MKKVSENVSVIEGTEDHLPITSNRQGGVVAKDGEGSFIASKRLKVSKEFEDRLKKNHGINLA